MLNDKVIGMCCITGIVLANLIAWVYTREPIPPGVKEVSMIVVSGILGNIIGVKFKKP